MALDAATQAAYDSDPAVKAYLDAMAAKTAASNSPVTPSEQATGSYEASTSPYQGSVAAGEWLNRWMAAGRGPSDPNAPTISQVAWNEQNGVANPATSVPAGGETVGGGIFGGWSGVGTPVSATGANIYQQKQTNQSPFGLLTAGGAAPPPTGNTQGLLTGGGAAPPAPAGGGAPAPGSNNVGGGAPAPGSNNVGGSNSPGTPAPTGGGGGAAPAPGSNNVGNYTPPPVTPGVTTAGPPGTPGPSQNTGYSSNGAQLLADGTPWLDPATLASAANAQAVTRTVNPNELSGVQLAQLLAEGGPLADRARLEALQGANKAGLLNSSIAVGSAMGAITDRMTPFAMQQAQAYGTAASENLAAENTANLQNSQLGTTANLHNSDAINDRNKLQFNFNSQNFLQNDQQAQEMLMAQTGHIYDMEKQALLGTQAKELLQLESANKVLLQTSASAAASYQAYQTTVGEILKDPKMDARVAAERIAVTKAMFESQMKLIGGLVGIPLDDYLPSGGPSGTGTESVTNFDSAAYIAAHPEVGDKANWAGSAYDHYIQYGKAQGFAYTPLT